MDEKLVKIFGTFVTLMGSIGLLSYFLHIEYFPPIDISTMGGLLLTTGYVVLMLLVPMAVVFLSPYILILLAIPDRAAKRTPEERIKLVAVSTLLCTLCLLITSFVPLLVFEVTASMLTSITAYLILLILIKLGVDWLTITSERRHQQLHSNDQKPIARALRERFLADGFNFLFIAFLQLSPLALLSMILHDQMGPDAQITEHFAPFLTYAVVSGFAGGGMLYFALTPNKRPLATLAFAAGLPLLPMIVSFFVGAQGTIPLTIARVLKVGNFRTLQLAIPSATCRALPATLGVDCGSADSGTIHLCNVHVMSRVGSETYLLVPGQPANRCTNNPIHELLVPSAELKYMRVDSQKKFISTTALKAELTTNTSTCVKNSTSVHAVRQR